MNKKELLFCREYLICFDEKKAAIAAGYDLEKRPLSSLQLLYKKEVVGYIKDQLEREKQLMPSIAKLVAKRVAISSVSDAVYYATNKNKLSKEEIEGLDLFMVNEVKVKEDSVELKFCDRMKALDLLLEQQEESEEQISNFLGQLTNATKPVMEGSIVPAKGV